MQICITDKYEPQPQACPQMSGKPMEFSNCFTAFLILICGGILAFVFIGLEFIIKPFDHILDGIRQNFGYQVNDDDEFENWDQLLSTVNAQRHLINQMRLESAMNKKSSECICFR